MPGNYQDKLDPWSSHSTIQKLLRAFPAGTRVLDVGTASGTIGKICQDQGFLLRGVEPVAAWAEESRPFYEEICAQDLEHTSDAFLTAHQVVICADVLEHMPDPEAQLRRLVRLQQPGAVFLISVPNIANLWVRLNLLFGKFDYTDRGILDRTHLRFFTRRTITDMLAAAGLEVRKVQATPIPLNLVSPFFADTALGRRIHAALAALTRALPALLGYQFVIAAVKP